MGVGYQLLKCNTSHYTQMHLLNVFNISCAAYVKDDACSTEGFECIQG